RVKAGVDKTTILIGEQLKLNLEATVPAGTSFTWFRTDTIPHFDIVDKGKPDTSADAGNNIYRQQIIITSFDSGSWTIPAFVLQSGKKKFKTDTLSINVTYSPDDTTKSYHDIKDIMAVENPGNPYIPWIIAAVTVLALAGILYFLMKKKKAPPKPAEKPVSKLSPFEEAMQSLNEVRKEDLQVKQYYTRLNDILRWYVYRKFGFASLEKTNDELVMQLRQTRLSHPDYTTLAQALRMADFVKFAKYTPSPEEQEETFQVIKNSISRLEASAAPPPST
ncbi:MAG TPA: hypothetical protein VEB42_02970, partial [Chitinophagaceae bacterium]|nr:hypothetical protein [Chitinophagaceae bacterium]